MPSIIGGIRNWIGLFFDKGGHVYNIKHPDFGAKGDGKKLLDAAITTGTPNFTSTLAGFTLADQGKSIAVAGAGTPAAGSGTVSAAAGVATFSTSQAALLNNGSVIIVAGVAYTLSGFNGTTGGTLSGAPTFGASAFTTPTNLSTTILTYVSATAVTLAANAGRTVAGATAFFWLTDDALAIDAASLAAYNAGGGTVFIPPGVYVLGTLSSDPNAYSSYIVPRDGVSFRGAGIGVSILAIKPGENARFPSFNAPYVIGTQQATPLTNTHYSHYTVDWNGALNLISQAMVRRNNSAIHTQNGATKFLVEYLEVKETPGNQCVFVNNVNYNRVQGKNVIVRHSHFTDSGSGLPGNVNIDHSSVFLQSDEALVENNNFRSTLLTWGTCYELHGSRSHGEKNKSLNYQRGFYITSDGTVGSGTVATTAGVATFSASQAAAIANGSVVTVAGVQYVVSAFDGTTGAILSPLGSVGPPAGPPTFGASAFTLGGTRDVFVDKDFHDQTRYACAVVSPTSSIDNVKVRDTTFRQRPGEVFGSLEYFLNGNTVTYCGREIFEGCVFEGRSYANMRFMQVQRIADFKFNGNRVKGFNDVTAGFGIVASGLDLLGASGLIGNSYEINDNLFEDVYSPVSISAALGIKLFSARGNKFTNSVSTGQYAMVVNLTSGDGDIALNTVNANYLSPLRLQGTTAIKVLQPEGMSADKGDTSITIEPLKDPKTILYATALTAPRTVTLSATNPIPGLRHEINRTGLGAGTLAVRDSALAVLKTIPAATAATVAVQYDSAGVLRLVGYQPL